MTHPTPAPRAPASSDGVRSPGLKSLNLLFVAVAAVAALAACGGGGSSPPPPAVIILPPPPPAPPAPTPPAPAPVPVPPPVSLTAAANLRCICTAASCLPANANLYPDACAASGERRWIRSFLDESYLFYRGTAAYVAASPGSREYSNYTGSPSAYFNELTSVANPANDRFSFTMSTADASATFGGTGSAGYGIELSSAYPAYRVIYTEPNSPAARAGVPRGATLASINGVRMVTQADSAGRTRMYFPNAVAVDAYSKPQAGAVLSLGYTLPNNPNIVTVALSAQTVVPQPVLMDQVIATPSGKVGYIVFNDHIATAQNQMADAFARMQAAGVSDLVLDLRYNGGGYVFIAAQAAYMIGGSRVANIPVFDRLTYSDKRQAENFTYPFLGEYVPLQGRTDNRSGRLPAALNLSRVYILTQSGTCSASESIINGLKGTEVGASGVQVIQIGDTTCGKPYGFSQDDNNLTAHFAIEFQGLNNKGEGGFVNGIASSCAVADDLTRPLGDVNERMLATALATRAAGACRVPAASGFEQQKAVAEPVGRSVRSPMQSEGFHIRGLKLTQKAEK